LHSAITMDIPWFQKNRKVYERNEDRTIKEVKYTGYYVIIGI